MNSNIKYEFEILPINHKHLLLDAFLYWYEKNGKQINSDITEHVQDMFESVDTEIFSLKLNSDIFGIFFYIITNNTIEIGGGLMKGKKSDSKLAHIVFDFSVEYLINRNIELLVLSVINNHYKYNSLIKYYKSYGFKITNINADQTFLTLKIDELGKKTSP